MMAAAEERAGNRGSYYDNCPENEDVDHDMSFYSSGSENSDEEEESDNHIVTGVYWQILIA